MAVHDVEFDGRDAVPLHRRRKGSVSLEMATMAEPLRRVNDFLYISPGVTNSHLITTPEGDIVIGTGLAIEGVMHRTKYNEVSTKPVRKIILTQGHLDLVGGTNAFKGPGSEVIAHKDSNNAQEDDVRIKGFREIRNPRFFPSELSAMGEADKKAISAGLASVYTTVKPDVAVDKRHNFTLGGMQVEVITLPGGETQDSLMVWLPQHRIVFTGNALGPLFPHMPNIHTIRGDRPRPILPYLATYQAILDLKPEILVTGHFNPIKGADFIAEELTRLRDAVQYVHDETVRGMNEGATIDALKRTIRLPKHLEVGEDYGTVIWAVEAIWYGYGGWFQMRSTTELYGVPPHLAYAEVAALAGSPALGKRALALAKEGKHLEAIHLSEMALAGDPKQADALKANLAAQEALLAASPQRNRWYKYWLEGEIASVKARLAQAGG